MPVQHCGIAHPDTLRPFQHYTPHAVQGWGERGSPGQPEEFATGFSGSRAKESEVRGLSDSSPGQGKAEGCTACTHLPLG